MPTEGRREANKARTRAAVLDAAQRLFAERGYQSTTVREIAEAAGVTERTFYRYFEGKEGIFAGEVIGWIDTLRAAIVARPKAEPPIEAVSAAMAAVIDTDLDRGLGRLLEGARPLQALRSAFGRPLRRLEDVIADALRERRGVAEASFHEEVIARAAVAALRSAVMRHRALLATDSESPGVVRLLQDAFAILSNAADATVRAKPDHTNVLPLHQAPSTDASGRR
jgi:AcrR family transcriptional regulator